jgi:predicted nucleic acid-binding protein
MSAIVVDASVALKLLRDEPGHAEACARLRKAVLAGDALLVPSLFWLEVVNVLAHRYRYPPPAVVEAAYELERLGLTTTEVGRPGVLAVIDAVTRTGVTAYDAAYLALAEATDGRLLTADARLAAAAGDRAELIAPEGGIAEIPPPYAGEPAWTRWKGAPAYLAELRSGL